MNKQILTVLALIASLTAYADDFVCTTNSLGVVKLTGYTGTNQLVIVPDTISTIGEKAFAKHSEIQTIYLPDSVTEIDNDAFADCTNLAYLRMSTNIQKLGISVFFPDYKLDYVYIPNAAVVRNYCGYKWWSIGTVIKPWLAYSVTGDSITLVYDGTLQVSTDLINWQPIIGDGYHVAKTTTTKFYRSVNK